MSQEIAIGKNQIIFCKVEATKNVAPAIVTGDCLLVTSAVEANQPKAFNEDNQKRMTLGKIDRFAEFYNIGTFNWSAYHKASGTAGDAPMESTILKGCFGIETIVGGTSVTYEQRDIDDDLLTYTVVYQKGHEIVWLTGCIFDRLSWAIKADDSDDGLVGYTTNGMYIQESRAGIDALDGAQDGSVVPITALEVLHADRYTGTPRIMIGTDDNTDAGYLVTAINYATNTLTISPGMNTDQADAAVVKGWIPAVTDAGYVMHGRWQLMQDTTDGGSNWNDLSYITEMNIELNNNISHNNAIKNNSAYPSVNAYALGDREVTLEWSGGFDKASQKYNYYAGQQTNLQVTVPFGDTAGSKGLFTFGKVRIDVPEKSGDNEMDIKVRGVCLESTSLNDSMTLAFT